MGRPISSSSLFVAFLGLVSYVPATLHAEVLLVDNYASFPFPVVSGSLSLDSPGINESGNIVVQAFKGRLPGSYVEKIFFGSGSVLTEVKSLSGVATVIIPNAFEGDRFLFGGPSINNANQVSYGIRTGANSAPSSVPKIERWDAGTTTTVQSGPSVKQTTRFTGANLTDSGAIVFTDSSLNSVIVNTNGVLSTTSLNAPIEASVNANGDIVVYSETSAVGSLWYKSVGSSAFTKVSGTVAPSRTSRAFAINDAGQIVYVNNDGDIWTTDATGIPSLRYDLPDTFDFNGELAINASGDIAFVSFTLDGTLGDNRDHLYFLEAGASEAVLLAKAGTTSFGLTPTFIDIGTSSLNDHDQIAFRYGAAGISNGVAVIQYVAVPEASSMVLALLGVTVGSLQMFRRHRGYAMRV